MNVFCRVGRPNLRRALANAAALAPLAASFCMAATVLNTAQAATAQAATEAKPLNITDVATSDVSFGRAVVTWKTDRPATSQVRWGTTVGYVNASAPHLALTTDHRVALDGLPPATTLHFLVESKDAAGVQAAVGGGAFTTGVDAKAPFAFSFGFLGPRRVVAGHTLYVALSTTLLSGEARAVNVSGDAPPPAGVDYTLRPWGQKPQKTAALWLSNGATLALSIDKKVRPGRYKIGFTADAGQGVKRRIDVPFVVEAMPAAARKMLSYKPVAASIPRFSQWEADMRTFGRKQCARDIDHQVAWEGGVWYYDGAKVFYQIADYTRDPSWKTGARRVALDYRKYVLDNKGKIPGHRIFTRGLLEDYERTGDEASRQAVVDLAHHAAFASNDPGGMVDAEGSRETAYNILAFLDNEEAGGEPNPNLTSYVDNALGHLDQWFVQKSTPYVKPFMFALTAQALIEYHKRTHDPRILPALETGANALWTEMWHSDKGGFGYLNVETFEAGPGAAPDLNLLIAPVYAWLFRHTGDTKWRERGGLVFAGGVGNSWLDGGKQFSQNYRWSFEFVRLLQLMGADPTRDKTAPALSPGALDEPFAALRTLGDASQSRAAAPQRAIITVSTNESAECRYASRPGVAYAAMTQPLRTYTGHIHRALVRVPGAAAAGKSFTVYIKAIDGAGNVSPDYPVTIPASGATTIKAVAAPAAATR